MWCHRSVIIAKRKDQVIQPVLAPELFMTGSAGQHNWLIVMWADGVINPAHVFCYWPAGQQAYLPDHVRIGSVWTIKQAAQKPVAYRCGPITFSLFVCRDQSGPPNNAEKLILARR